MAKKKPVKKAKKRPAAKKAAPKKIKKKAAPAKRKAPPKAKKTPRPARKSRPKQAAASAAAMTPFPPPPPPAFIQIQFPLAGAMVPSTFPANGIAGGVNGVQGTMTSNTTGQSYQGQVLQPPPNWRIQFTNLPRDDYTLTVSDPVSGASDTQQPIHVQMPHPAPW